MHTRVLSAAALLLLFCPRSAFSAPHRITSSRQPGFGREAPNSQVVRASGALSSQTTPKINEIIDRVFKRETEEEEIIASYTPIIETYLQIEKSDTLLGTVPKNDFYFLGIADYHKSRIHVRSMTESEHKGSMSWSFVPAETEGKVQDESDRQDRSPLAQQRDWRELAESNVLDGRQQHHGDQQF